MIFGVALSSKYQERLSMSGRMSKQQQNAFTLVELLVVIAIIGVMVGLLVPAVQAARESARRMQCMKQLEAEWAALHNYESTYRTFPAGCVSRVTGPWPGGANDPVPEAGPVEFLCNDVASIEQPGLFETIDFTRPITILPIEQRAVRS